MVLLKGNKKYLEDDLVRVVQYVCHNSAKKDVWFNQR